MAKSEFTFFCSWSGGKDSSLSLYRAIKLGGRPINLLNMLREDGERSRSHGLTVNALQMQSKSLGIPIVMRPTTWDDYEANFISVLRELKKKGIEVGVFGDIDIEEHREWVERVCSIVDIKPILPLWKTDRKVLVNELIELGFKATIVVVNEKFLGKEFLGKTLDADVMRELENVGVDISGENGEYHTIVTDGPIFSTPIKYKAKEKKFNNGYWFLDIAVF